MQREILAPASAKRKHAAQAIGEQFKDPAFQQQRLERVRKLKIGACAARIAGCCLDWTQMDWDEAERGFLKQTARARGASVKQLEWLMRLAERCGCE